MDHLRGKPLGLLVMQISGDVLDQGHLTLSQHSDLDWIRDRLFKKSRLPPKANFDIGATRRQICEAWIRRIDFLRDTYEVKL